MTDDPIRWLGQRPSLDDPVMVVALSGWIDAGGAAAAAMAAIHEETGATPFAMFDDDQFIDFRARRPTMELREGLNSVLRWEHIRLSAGRDQAGHDLVLLDGPEPDMAWHRFGAALTELADDLGVSKMVTLGAYPFAAPHTRPSRLSVSTPSPDVLASVSFLRSSVDVPAGMAASLEHSMHAKGIPALTVWAQVPHYIATMSYPPATISLLDGLREAADVIVDGTSVRQDSIVQRRRLDKMVAENPEHQQMIAQLEELYDASDDSVDSETGGPTLEMRSGDELAAELEQFLRDQD